MAAIYRGSQIANIKGAVYCSAYEVTELSLASFACLNAVLVTSAE